MGSPLGPLFADLFLSRLETCTLQQHIQETDAYLRYVDDIFIVCESRSKAEDLLIKFNSCHPNLNFTVEHEENGTIKFLDVLMTKMNNGTIERSIFRKSSWTRQYMHFKSFVPIQYKKYLVRTLFNRARKICSDSTIEHEIKSLKDILCKNGYPEKFKETTPCKTIQTVPKKPVYINLPFKGDDVHGEVKRRLDKAIKRTYYAAKLVILYTTKRVLQQSGKDQSPILDTSNCIYQFECVCGSKYIGRTERRLSTRTMEHSPKWLKIAECKVPKSSITKPLVDYGHDIDAVKSFTIVSKQTNKKMLAIAEACAIRIYKPALCIQKEMVFTLNLPR
uniref:Reverse transcriptase domain-containing protein n=1 Tax=Trichobilharzia regenti TaxID=157069 RepID=A0AA85JMX7_TRIRE|nr:unnamed protein product [Trichobilharzia regenti]